MPRKIPKWQQNRSGPDKHALSARIGVNKLTGKTPEFISSLKNDTSSDQLFDILLGLRLDKKLVGDVHGDLFPKKISGIFSKKITAEASTLANEIIWAIASLITCGKELKEFVKHKESFELAILSDNQNHALETLSATENDFGWSVWYIQNTLANAQYREGVEEKRRLNASYEKQIEGNTLLSVLLFFMAKRIEGTAVPGYLQSELINYFEGVQGVAYRFLRTKLFDLADPDIDTLALTLSVDSHFSAIDYYESLIATLQAIAVNEGLTATVAHILSKPAKALFRATLDRRLVPILIAFGVIDTHLYAGVSSREKFIEAYSKGNYEDALILADSHLSEHADDMGALVMRIRAEVKLGGELKKRSGIVGEIEQHLLNVIGKRPAKSPSELQH